MDGDGEEVTACLFGDGISAIDTGKIDEGRFDDTTFAVCSFQDAFGEAGVESAWWLMNSGIRMIPKASICHG